MFLNHDEELALKLEAMDMALALSRQHILAGNQPMRSSEIESAAKKFYRFLKDGF